MSNKLEYLKAQYPQFFLGNKIKQEVDRKTREAITQILLGDAYTLTSITNIAAQVTCNKCGYQFSTEDPLTTKCPGQPAINLQPKHPKANKPTRALYVWKAAGLQLYRVGETRSDLRRTRIDEQAKALHLNPELIFFQENTTVSLVHVLNELGKYKYKHKLYRLTPKLLEVLLSEINKS